MDFIDHRRGDLGDTWKDRSGFKHRIPIAGWKNGGDCTSMEAWQISGTQPMIGWFKVNESANELGSVISVTCVDIYLGKDTAH